VLPLALDLVAPESGRTYLDLGCGEGRLMSGLGRAGATAVGIDVAPDLVVRAAAFGEVHLAEVPPIPLASDSVDGVAVVLVLEHIRDEEEVMAEAARVTRPGGVLALVINHPVWTAPGSTPILDEAGEMLWRPGEYFSVGWSDEPAGVRTVRFHHRTMSRLLNSAAAAGWALEHMVEEGVTDTQIARTSGLAGQEHIPRLLGVRWRLG
jgi:SAM-dependent methyltransferase